MLPLIALQVENCAVTISSSDFGAVSKKEQEQKQEQEQEQERAAPAAVEEFPALGSAAAPKKNKNTKTKDASPAAASPPRAPAAHAAATYSQVTVLLDASGWTLKMASLDALRWRVMCGV